MQILHLDRPKWASDPLDFFQLTQRRVLISLVSSQANAKIGAINNPSKFETIDTTIITVFPTPVSGTMFTHQFPNWVSP